MPAGGGKSGSGAPPDMPTPFEEKVYRTVRTIPRGGTLTYGQVAEKIGCPGTARAVGNALSKNFDPAIPCHRVVRGDGPGGYNRGKKKKIQLLKKESRLV